MKNFPILGLLLSLIPGVTNAAILTYEINFGQPDTYNESPPTGTFSVNSDYQLDGQGRILQEDILSFEVRAGSGDFLVFDLTDTIVSPLTITRFAGQFYFDVSITDTEDLCDWACPYGTLTMQSTLERDWFTQENISYNEYWVNHSELWANMYGYLELQTTTPGAVPVPAAAWLFLSGLVGVVGAARRNKAA